MVNKMQKTIIALLLGILLFGCINLGGTKTTDNSTSTVSSEQNKTSNNNQTDNSKSGLLNKPCNENYLFSQLDSGVLSKDTAFVVTASCASGKKVAIYLDNSQLEEKTISSDASIPMTFTLKPKKDGTLKVEVKADGSTVYSKEWEVKPIGFTDTSGSENDPVSIKQWKAVAFDVDNTITAKTIRLYMRRLNYNILSDTEVFVELRSNNNGNPADGVLASSKRYLNETTLTDNWILFKLDKATTLAKGKYWIVMKIAQPSSPIVSDVVNIHNLPIDKNRAGNDYHKQMTLNRNEDKGIWEETSWQPLSYDKKYCFKVSAE